MLPADSARFRVSRAFPAGLLIALLAAPVNAQSTPEGSAPPDAVEQKKILADAAENVIRREINLPNFICTQLTRRFEDFAGKGEWRPIDIIVERLTYFEHREDYQVLELNGRPANLPHSQLGGASSSGEFGSVIKGIFAIESSAEFHWQNFFRLRGRSMYVYAYSVAAAHSTYHIVIPEQSVDYKSAYHGLLFIDAHNHQVHRITLHADGIPPALPVQDV